MKNLNDDLVKKTETIRGLYLGLLGREPDEPGLSHWLKVWMDGGDLNCIVDHLTSSEEYKSGTKAIIRDEIRVAAQVMDALKFLPECLSERPLLIVDVGAQNLENEKHVYSDIVRELPHRIIGFEPLEHRRQERLSESGIDHITLLPAFIGDGDRHTFYINDPDATSSLLPFNEDIIKKFRDLDTLKTIRTEPANTVKLDEALQQEKYIDFLKLDIQGAELAALQQSSATLSKTLVVHCEVSFFEIYKGQPLFSEVEQYMRSLGFELVDLRSECRYPLSETPFS